MAVRIQLFGHSFVTRLKSFIPTNDKFNYKLNLHQPALVQYSGYSGANIAKLRDNLETIEDFQPHIVIVVIGTNDLYDNSNTPQSVTQQIMDLVDSLLFRYDVQKVIICPVLHRIEPTVRTRWPVHVPSFNRRVDETNTLLQQACTQCTHERAIFWRFKGFWSEEAKSQVFAADGVHLSNRGQIRFYQNLRGAVVSLLKSGFFVIDR
jgi:lysophospholipase L1-like esterase